MSWRITFAAAAEQDLALILDHLIESYVSFGDDPGFARQRAGERLMAILDDAQRIAGAPQRGTNHAELLPGLRQLTLGKASFWFIPDGTSEQVRILAVLFGGQDQQRRMLIRLLGPLTDH